MSNIKKIIFSICPTFQHPSLPLFCFPCRNVLQDPIDKIKRTHTKFIGLSSVGTGLNLRAAPFASDKESSHLESTPFYPSSPSCQWNIGSRLLSEDKHVFGLFYRNLKIILNYLGPNLVNMLNGQVRDREFSLRLCWKKRGRPKLSCVKLRNEPPECYSQKRNSRSGGRQTQTLLYLQSYSGWSNN